MNILFHLASPEPPIPGTDAVFQETESLRRHFGGENLCIYPLNRPSRIFPKQLYGMHCIRRLRELEPSIGLHHLFYATLYPFPWLRLLRKPLVYSAVSGIGSAGAGGRSGMPKGISTLVSSNPRDERQLNAIRPGRCKIIRPGIEVGRFVPQAIPLRDELVLLAGSAPWTSGQFRTKGIDLLLETAKRMPLRIVFLWRGLLLDELRNRIARYRLGERVEIITGFTDVNALLSRVHATVVLAENGWLVKAYPHSLMESLAAGKPVLVSACIPMSDYVSEACCGEVVSVMDFATFRSAIKRLTENYARLQAAALARGREDFALGKMLKAYGEVYREALG